MIEKRPRFIEELVFGRQVARAVCRCVARPRWTHRDYRGLLLARSLAVSALEFVQRMAIIGGLRRLRGRVSRALSNAAKPRLKTAQTFQEIRDSLLIRM